VHIVFAAVDPTTRIVSLVALLPEDEKHPIQIPKRFNDAPEGESSGKQEFKREGHPPTLPY